MPKNEKYLIISNTLLIKVVKLSSITNVFMMKHTNETEWTAQMSITPYVVVAVALILILA